ncbi:hypothetical protein OAU25_01310 [Crocinitomicaceae bacterium]|nr:hypothetical protein [Crocinitomicaceae bacterium]
MKNATRISFKVFLSSLAISALGLISFGQNSTANFTGILIYKITPRDSVQNNVSAHSTMVIYTNDTITRTENYTNSLGKQVSIRHIELNKSYLLVAINDTSKYAIQTNLNTPDSLKKESKYTFKFKAFKRKIRGMKAKRVNVDHPDFDGAVEFLYLKNSSNKYLNNFGQIPGLLVKYSIATPNGVFDYELVKFERFLPSHNLFGIPSDYKRVSVETFMKELMNARDLNPE